MGTPPPCAAGKRRCARSFSRSTARRRLTRIAATDTLWLVSTTGKGEAPPPLHDLEAEVMQEMWSVDEAPVRAVMEALNARTDRARKYTTIMTIMARLHRKGLLERRRSGRSDIYAAALTREQYLEARAREEVGVLVERYGDVALVHFARQMHGLDPERREKLRRIARK